MQWTLITIGKLFGRRGCLIWVCHEFANWVGGKKINILKVHIDFLSFWFENSDFAAVSSLWWYGEIELPIPDNKKNNARCIVWSTDHMTRYRLMKCFLAGNCWGNWRLSTRESKSERLQSDDQLKQNFPQSPNNLILQDINWAMHKSEWEQSFSNQQQDNSFTSDGIVFAWKVKIWETSSTSTVFSDALWLNNVSQRQ